MSINSIGQPQLASNLPAINKENSPINRKGDEQKSGRPDPANEERQPDSNTANDYTGLLIIRADKTSDSPEVNTATALERVQNAMQTSQTYPEPLVINNVEVEFGGGFAPQSYISQTFSLDLTTQDGDTIQVRSSLEVSNGNISYYDGDTPDGYWTSQSYSDRSETYNLYVEGTLSEQERDDLMALLSEADALANEFYSGDLNVAYQLATELGIDGTSFQSANLSMQEVEVSGHVFFAADSTQSRPIPQGLSPLKDYAESLINEQGRWADRFHSDRGLATSLANHPVDTEGSLKQFAEALLL